MNRTLSAAVAVLCLMSGVARAQEAVTQPPLTYDTAVFCQAVLDIAADQPGAADPASLRKQAGQARDLAPPLGAAQGYSDSQIKASIAEARGKAMKALQPDGGALDTAKLGRYLDVCKARMARGSL